MQILGEPLIYHESPQFRTEFREAIDLLGALIGCQREPAVTTSSITGACAGTLANLSAPGDEIVLGLNGNFASMWQSLACEAGVTVHAVEVPWGAPIEAEAVRRAIEDHPRATMVCIIHCETSTGAVSDLSAIAEVCSSWEGMLVVDAATTAGVVPFDFDGWGIDVAISGSQKAFGVPPGLGVTWLSERALDRCQTMLHRRWDWQWDRLVARQRDGCLYTPAVPLWRAIHRSLKLMQAEGQEAVWARAARVSRATRAGAHALGLSLFSPDSEASVPVTALQLPRGIDGSALRQELATRYRVVVAGGHKHLSSRLIRIGSLGWVDEEALIRCFQGLQDLLRAEGHQVMSEAPAAVERALVAPA